MRPVRLSPCLPMPKRALPASERRAPFNAISDWYPPTVPLNCKLPIRPTASGILPASSLRPSPFTISCDTVAAHRIDVGRPLAEPFVIKRMSAGE